jgi:hypothetical protein
MRAGVELEQLLNGCIQYAFSLLVTIERCCGINANHVENCQSDEFGSRDARCNRAISE